MKPLKPRDKDWAKFQFNVYKRVESWCNKVGIDPNNIEYEPLIKGKDTVKRPDIILSIEREPTELNFSYYLVIALKMVLWKILLTISFKKAKK